MSTWRLGGRSTGTTRFWNDEAFNGASLPYAALLEAEDPVASALDFLLQGYGILHTS